MDQLADPALEAGGSPSLVFPSGLIRPWLVANAVAFTIGAGIAGGMLRALLDPAIEQAATRTDVAAVAAIGTGLPALTFGIILGAAQWLVLRRAIPAAWWIPVTGIGWGLAGALVGFNSGGSSWETLPSAGPITPFIPPVLIVPLEIALLGSGQWLVLRRACAGAGWWLLVNVAAFLAAALFGFLVASALPFISPTDFPSAKALIIVGAAAGPVYGSLTWWFLGQLPRRPD